MFIIAYASTYSEAKAVINKINDDDTESPIALPLVMLQHSKSLFFTIVDYITYVTDSDYRSLYNVVETYTDA